MEADGIFSALLCKQTGSSLKVEKRQDDFSGCSFLHCCLSVVSPRSTTWGKDGGAGSSCGNWSLEAQG